MSVSSSEILSVTRPRDAVFALAALRELVWLPERGMGYYPVSGLPPYDAAYFDKYVEYAATTMGHRVLHR